MTEELQILTLNCWALKPVSKFRAERIDAIADLLASSPQYGLVCLQELWVHEDYVLVRDRVANTLPYTKFFFTGALGSGLAILSRFPILSSLTIPYHLTGRPFGFGDFFVNKAAGSVVVEHPTLGEIEVFTTHMHAGGPEGWELGGSYRSTQAWRLSNEIRRASSQGRFVIACGDYNFQSNELPYEILRDHGRVQDAWLVSHEGGDLVGQSCSSPESGMHVAGVTVDSSLNTWTLGKNIPEEVQRTQGKRLDYVFFRPPQSPARWADSTPSSSALTCKETEVVVTDLVPGKPYSYSDHFGLRALFTFPSSSSTAAPASTSRTGSPSPSGKARFDSSGASNRSVASSNPPGGDGALPTLRKLHALVQLHRSAHIPNARKLLLMVPTALVALVALTVSSAFLPLRSYLAPIFVLLAGLAGFGGCTALAVGFVWGRWEDSGLRRVIEEVEEEMDRVGGGLGRNGKQHA